MMSLLFAIFLINQMYPLVPIGIVVVCFAYYLVLYFHFRDPKAERKFFLSLGVLLGGWTLVICVWFLPRFRM